MVFLPYYLGPPKGVLMHLQDHSSAEAVVFNSSKLPMFDIHRDSQTEYSSTVASNTKRAVKPTWQLEQPYFHPLECYSRT